MRIGALFAQPFMPEKATRLLDILGIEKMRRDLRYAKWGADNLYGWKGSEPPPEPYVFPRPSKKDGTGKGESMLALMQRKKAVKEANKARQRAEFAV
jgi:methionyl-tRNA synthetase